MKRESITLKAAVRALMRHTGMDHDEAQRQIIRAIQDGKLPVMFEDLVTGARGQMPPGAFKLQ